MTTAALTSDIQALRECMLFRGFSERDLATIATLLEERRVSPGTTIVDEGEQTEDIYIIRQGVVDVVKRAPRGGAEQRLTTLGAGRTFGEIAFVDRQPRSASVRAVETTTVCRLPMEKLRALAACEPRLEAGMLRNLSGELAHRLRGTSETTVRALEKELALERSRIAMGTYVTYVIGLLVAYMFLLRFAIDFVHTAASSSFVSIPMILAYSGALLAMAKHTGEPLSEYGLTLRGWRPSLVDALRWTLPVLALFAVLKWVLTRTMAAYATDPVFSFGGAFDPSATPESTRFHLLMTVAYVSIVPVQEFAARGALQGPLERFLTGPRAVPLAIVIANAMFVASHLHLSTTFAVAAFAPGLLWGWLYSRNQTLIGPVVSHVLIGMMTLYVLNLDRLLH